MRGWESQASWYKGQTVTPRENRDRSRRAEPGALEAFYLPALQLLTYYIFFFFFFADTNR